MFRIFRFFQEIVFHKKLVDAVVRNDIMEPKLKNFFAKSKRS